MGNIFDIPYIGILKEAGNIGPEKYGNAFFISPDSIITANHTVDNLKDSNGVVLMLGDRELPIDINRFDPYDSLDIAIYHFSERIFNRFEDYSFNTANSSFNLVDYPWQVKGHLKEKTGYGSFLFSGNRFDLQSPSSIIISGGQSSRAELYGLSGSPVFINNMIVGIVQTAVVRSGEPIIGMIPIKYIENHIADFLKENNVYSFQAFPPKDYNEKFKEYSGDAYIPRTCIPYKCDIYTSFDSIDLLKRIKNNSSQNRIALIGEGDIGKTFEMKRLAAELSKECLERKSSFHPVYCALKSYHQGIPSIEDIDNDLKTYIDKGVPFCLLLDGYDDILEERDRSDFEKKLKRFAPKTEAPYTVIVSTRKNYYRQGMFNENDSFEEIEICPLYQYQINNYLSELGVNADAFMKEAYSQELTDACGYPFYLNKLIELFRDEHKLPPRSELSEIIIDRVLEDCYQKHGDLGEGLSQKNNIMTKNYLSQISMFLCAMGGNQIDDGSFTYMLNEGNIKQKNVIKKSGFISKEDGIVYYIHSNLYEFLTAKYLNEKYTDNLQGLLDLIQDTDQTSILPMYRGIVTFLVSMRENNDLAEWLLKSFPSSVEYFENDKLDKAELAGKFKSVFMNLSQKCQYIEFDGDSNFEKWAEIADVTDYLLSVVRKDTDLPTLINSLHMLSVDPHLSDNKDKVSGVIKELLSRELEPEHKDDVMIRVLNILTAGKIDDGICDRFMEQYEQSTNEILIRKICLYLTEISRADDYCDFVISAVPKCSQSSFVPFEIRECISSFRKKESITRFFGYLADLIKRSKPISALPKLMSEKLYKSALEAFQAEGFEKSDRELLGTILFRLGAHHDIKTIDIWCNIFIETGCESEAIVELYERYKPYPIQFTMMTHLFSNYTAFLEAKFDSGEFDRDIGFMFMCIRQLNDDDPKKAELMSFLSSKDENNTATKILSELTRDREQSLAEQNAEELAQIFSFEHFKEIILDVIKSTGKDDLTYSKFFDASIKYSNKQAAYIAMNLLTIFPITGNSIMQTLNKIETAPDGKDSFFIENVSRFISYNNDNYALLSPEQNEAVTDFCIRFITKYDFTTTFKYHADRIEPLINTHVLEAVLLIIKKLEISISKDKLSEMLYIPTSCFPDTSGLGIPEMLKKELSDEEITGQLEKWNGQGLVCGYYIDICLRYGIEIKSEIGFLYQAAMDRIQDPEMRSYHSSAWEYLSSHGHLHELAVKAANGDIYPGTVIEHISELTELKDFKEWNKLNKYVSDTFDKLYALRSEIIENEDIIEKVKAEYPYIIEYDNNTGKEHVVSSIEHHLQRLFVYLSEKDIGNYIDIYLDEIIAEKRKSILDYDETQTRLSHITNIKYLDKTVEVFTLLYSRQIRFSGEFTTMISDTETALKAMAESAYTEVRNKIAALTASDTANVKRGTYNLLKSVDYAHNAQNIPKPNLHDVIHQIFKEDQVYPF